MKKIFLISCLSMIGFSSAEAQDTCTPKRIFLYTDDTKETIIIKEYLIYSAATKEYLPFTYPAKLFLTKSGPGKLPLGIRYYNFGCVKTPKKGFWKGQVCKDGYGHAIFAEPEYGIRAFIQLIVSYIEERGKNTLYAIFNMYAPANDCIGSARKILVNGKWVCPPCCPNNDPGVYAKKVGDALGVGVHEQLKIRDAAGKISEKLVSSLMTEVSKMEIGGQWKNCKFDEETIKRLIDEL